jgi:putative endonuclease
VYSQEFFSMDEAIAAERQIKGWTRKKKEALINGQYDLLHKLAQCQNDTHARNNA